MKNVQIIDNAVNTEYAIYKVSEAVFKFLFPNDGQNIEFIEDVISRSGVELTSKMINNIWNCKVTKSEVKGLHGTLFYGLIEKKKFYPTKAEPPITDRLVE